MAEPDISETREGARGRYALRLDDDSEADLTYTMDGERMVIGRTFTPPEHRNKGIAIKLVERAVEDARTRGWRITPACPYVRIVIDRTPAFQDVLAS